MFPACLATIKDNLTVARWQCVCNSDVNSAHKKQRGKRLYCHVMCSLTDCTREFQDRGVYVAEVQQRLFTQQICCFLSYVKAHVKTAWMPVALWENVFLDELDLSFNSVNFYVQLPQWCERFLSFDTSTAASWYCFLRKTTFFSHFIYLQSMMIKCKSSRSSVSIS